MNRIVQLSNKRVLWNAVWAVFALTATTAMALSAQTFTDLVNFNGSNGYQLGNVSLLQGSDGQLYGTTVAGGANMLNCAGFGCGTIFRMSQTGMLTTLYSFCQSTPCVDGVLPDVGLLQAADGYLYGTTSGGGANGYGTVFRVTPAGALTTIHSFTSTEGDSISAGLVQAANGDFYGATPYGGASGNNGYGTIFRITPRGSLTTIHSFDQTDGQLPYAVLVQAASGDLYGTTASGGASVSGTIFKITPDGRFTSLYSFTGGAGDGGHPFAGLVEGADGNFYGTTNGGGANGFGTIFMITPAGVLTTLHSFDQTEGDVSYGALVQGTDGNFYGTNSLDGAGYGTVYQMTPAGTVTILHSFLVRDGIYPNGPLMQDTNGRFYGTTLRGGTGGGGDIFTVSVGLNPFVKTSPTFAKVGAAVKILGTNLKDATSVTFNGASAVFEAVSAFEITTAVPAGATSGTVEVVTPGNKLSSSVPFRVQ